MSLEVIATVAAWRRRFEPIWRSGRTIGLVPTMGALHAGHGALIDAARAQTDLVAATIFVNPMQFNQRQDFEKYPRPFEEDAAFCEARGVDFLFAPSNEEMYPAGHRSFVEVEGLAEHLCGRSRPGHFRGVATVVLKLLSVTRPDRAYFGEKDFQQLALIRRMVRDFNIPVEVTGVATVRESDGVALSSRNRRLTAEQRLAAPALYRALLAAQACVAAGERDPAVVRREASKLIEECPGVKLDYFDLVDCETTQPVARIEGPVQAAGAIWIGDVRLIDNVPIPMPYPKAGIVKSNKA